MTENFKTICESIRRIIIHKRGTMTRAELVAELAKLGYETNIKKITRLESDYDSETATLDFELLYYIFKVLNIRFDTLLFPEEDRTVDLFIDRLAYFKNLTSDGSDKKDEKNTFYETLFQSDFITNILPRTKPESKELLKMWKDINNNAYRTILPPRVAVLGDYAVGTTTFINTILDNPLKNTSCFSQSTNITYYISSLYKPSFLSDEIQYAVYKGADFNLSSIYDKDNIASELSQNNVSVYFFDNPILKNISLIECKSSSDYKEMIIKDAEQFIILCNREIRNELDEIIKISNLKQCNGSYNIIDNVLDRINLVFPKQDVVIKKDKLDIKRKLAEKLNTEQLKNIDKTVEIINRSVGYDASVPATYDDIANLINNILDYFDIHRHTPFINYNRIPVELEYLIKNKYPAEFFDKISDYWNDFIKNLSETLNDVSVINNYEEFLNTEFNIDNKEILSMIEEATGKLPDSNILKISKETIGKLIEKIDEITDAYFINNVYHDEGSSVYKYCFNKETSNSTINEFLKIKYEDSLNENIEFLPTCNLILENITGAAKPRAKSIIKKLTADNPDNLQSISLRQINVLNENIISSLKLKKTKYDKYLTLFQSEQNRIDLDKLRILYSALKVVETEARENHAKLYDPDFYELLKISNKN